ncbi:hypothetical protein COO60DRAFT_1114800 [Scenedesmus sp. NREL 46B-D3]|nr:hypothetical protein COO60DRAFT_1114800 [Scenedesmus sp. NREL 46B-D3]
MDSSTQAALLRIQNMMLLCQQLKLPVHFKVSSIHCKPAGTATAEAEAARHAAQPASIAAAGLAKCFEQPAGEATRELAVVVHVLSDYAFKKYLQHCSASDLLLLRGLLLKVKTDAAMSCILSAHVQQAFLPKLKTRARTAA